MSVVILVSAVLGVIAATSALGCITCGKMVHRAVYASTLGASAGVIGYFAGIARWMP